jgi:hypothetical protein
VDAAFAGHLFSRLLSCPAGGKRLPLSSLLLLDNHRVSKVRGQVGPAGKFRGGRRPQGLPPADLKPEAEADGGKRSWLMAPRLNGDGTVPAGLQTSPAAWRSSR